MVRGSLGFRVSEKAPRHVCVLSEKIHVCNSRNCLQGRHSLGKADFKGSQLCWAIQRPEEERVEGDWQADRAIM